MGRLCGYIAIDKANALSLACSKSWESLSLPGPQLPLLQDGNKASAYLTEL